MSNIDKQALREAAEKATPGLWVYLPKNTSIEYDYGSDDSQGSITYMDSGDFTQKQTDLNGAFIAAANPATVLALLDELEAKDKQIAELEAPAPELKMAHLINKFYERYPLAQFKSDTERSAALGYFMAGAELQCFGEFINYAELMGDE
ncbi:ead/Ea22-like family protein [Enterobacter chengduensis]|uniref:ead/Ea22-like family protein n=1 Tax=Enterobacter chengduensis TaxID=2494701 RepID=UPI00064A67BC|nr:ead/Ea22-like family protein [Enterobacter chengduensis]